ncbi:Terpene synthase 5 [Euphorbia peplus]|nr:Terpene synthase 5 [Euphorbia peplus]
MLLHSTENVADNIEFINLLSRLGVSYHFEDEINEQLNAIFTMLPQLLKDNDYELHTIANLFRNLRMYGYKMECDVFEKLKDINGEFKEDICNDVKGILCLYEACFLMIPGENILVDALAFTRKCMEILAKTSSPHLQKHIRNSLMYPSHRTIERLDAINFISFYEKDEYMDATLLKFAKLDYNGLQLLYRKELALLSRWWKNLNVKDTLPFTRDRLVEAYTLVVGLIFEPQYSISRMFVCKFIAVAVPLDDFYDSYGTIEEFQVLTSTLQRFTMDGIDELPQYIKFICKLVFGLTENDGTQECCCKATFAKEMLKELAVALNREAIWQKERKVPSFDEYMRNGRVTSGYDAFSAAFILGAENMGMKEILWQRNNHETAVCARFHGRLPNDIAGTRKDVKRREFPKGVDCYMMQYDVSEDEALEAIHKILENKWKEMNEDMLRPNMVPRILLKFAINYCRGNLWLYKDTDLFTYGDNMMPTVTSFIINPLPM